MLAYEKFLCNYKSICDFPILSEKGFIAYQKKEKKTTTINFLFFSIDSSRNSLSTYSFKFTKIEIKESQAKNEVYNTNVEVDWENFFKSIKELKENILQADSYLVAENVDEADYLVWKSFVVINDAWFSLYFINFPTSFLEALNENKPHAYRNANKRGFLEYLKDNYSEMHENWAKYFQRDYCDYFCSWFYNYFNKKSN